MTTIDVYALLPEWAQDLTAQGILITDTDCIIRGWNRWLERASGRQAAEMIGRNLLEVYPDLVERHLDQLYRQALDGQVSVLAQRLHHYLLPLPAQLDSALFEYMQQSARIGPLLDAGRVVGSVTVIDDVSERVASERELRRLLAKEQAAYVAAENARGRLSFLLEVSTMLAETLDYEATLQQIARLLLPALADYCIIDLVTRDGQLRRVVTAHVDPAKNALLDELKHHFLRDETMRLPGLITIQTGKAQIFVDDTDILAPDRAPNPEQQHLIDVLGTQAVLAVPLSARGQILGAITLGSAHVDRYQKEDLSLIEVLARRVALAIDNAGLYQQAQIALDARDQALAIVEAERSKLQRLFAQAPAVICILEGPEHRYAFANVLYREIVGDRDLIGIPIREALPELAGQGFFELLDQVYITGESFIGTEMPMQIDRHGSGTLETIYFHFVYQVTRDSRGVIDGILMHAVDITAQVLAQRERANLLSRAEAARAEAEAAVRMRDMFFSIAAHELKTPLTSLQGNIQLIQRRALREDLLNERDQRAFSVVAAQAQRLRQMIEALLDVTRLESGQLSLVCAPLNLHTLVQQVIAEVRPTLTKHTIEYAYVEAAEPPIVNGDVLRLEQVLQNLLQNAVKYSPAGGPIEVRLAHQDQVICISVSDQGIGIPPEALPRLFRRFYRAANVDEQHISGMGIGLYVVKEIVALHDGTIQVESIEGEGSTFTVCLPLWGGVGNDEAINDA